ncbi:cell division protein FtsL [Marinobacterium sp. 3-1745]|uniref:Cell division protein FtsL n=2 Tax=Marinobacterium marinum TaxID=2756129 RepID=A0A7W1WYH7_9GAMM|nr:cell division protein FtsL [Marinobacterium marinum]
MLSGGELFAPVLISVVLTLAVMGSAMAVIFSAYEYRRLFNQHQILVQQWDEIQVEWGQYLLEQSVWSAHHRVEALAADQMNMVVPAVEAIEIVRNEQQ